MEEILLQEIRDLRIEVHAFRDEVTVWRQETGERIATMEAQMRTSVVGNGQPSRLAVVEAQVDDLQRERWKLTGIAAGAGGLFTIAVEVFRKKLGF